MGCSIQEQRTIHYERPAGGDLPPKAVPHLMLVPAVEQAVPAGLPRGAAGA
jgi:hypothetical protein